MPESKVEAIIFDLDNTLVDTTKCADTASQIVADLLRRTEPLVKSAGDVVDTFDRLLSASPYDINLMQETGKWRLDLWKEALRSTQDEDFESTYPDIESLAETLLNTWNAARLKNLVVSPEIIEMLKSIKDSGYRLAILTNGPTDIQQEKVDRCDAKEHFEVVIISGEIRAEKPEKKVFDYCLSKLGVTPDRAVMVGDSMSADIRGAQQAGFRAAVWINPSGVPVNSIYKADYEISNMLQFPDVLKRIEDCTEQ